MIENMKSDITDRPKVNECLKSTEEIVNIINPLFFEAIKSGKIELSATYLGFFRMVVNMIQMNKMIVNHDSTKRMIALFKTLAEKSEVEIDAVHDKVPEDQIHEIDIVKFNIKNLQTDLQTC